MRPLPSSLSAFVTEVCAKTFNGHLLRSSKTISATGMTLSLRSLGRLRAKAPYRMNGQPSKHFSADAQIQRPNADLFVDGKFAGTMDEESYHFTNDMDIYVPCQFHEIYAH